MLHNQLPTADCTIEELQIDSQENPKNSKITSTSFITPGFAYWRFDDGGGECGGALSPLSHAAAR